MTTKTYHGSCHCGAVAFTAEIDLEKGTQRCNCSICTKARTWFAGTGADAVAVTKGEDSLADYSWTPPPGGPQLNLHYRFCKTCGIRAFAKGKSDDLGVFYAVAIGALDDIEADADHLARSIKYVDGRHNAFEKAPADTRLM